MIPGVRSQHCVYISALNSHYWCIHDSWSSPVIKFVVDFCRQILGNSIVGIWIGIRILGEVKGQHLADDTVSLLQRDKLVVSVTAHSANTTYTTVQLNCGMLFTKTFRFWHITEYNWNKCLFDSERDSASCWTTLYHSIIDYSLLTCTPLRQCTCKVVY